MFDRTTALIHQTVDDIKKISFYVNLVSQIIYIAYLVYAVVWTPKYLPLNIVLLVLSVAFFVLFLLFRYKGDLIPKRVKGRITDAFKIARRAVQLVVIVTSLVAIYNTQPSVVTLQMLFSLASALTFVLNVIIDLIVHVVSARFALFELAIKADVNDFLDTKAGKVVSFFGKKILGKNKDKEEELVEN